MPRLAPVTRAVRPASFIGVLLSWPVLRSVAPGAVGRMGQVGPRDNLYAPTLVAVQPAPHGHPDGCGSSGVPAHRAQLARKAQSGAPVHVHGVDGARRPPRPAGILAE